MESKSLPFVTLVMKHAYLDDLPIPMAHLLSSIEPDHVLITLKLGMLDPMLLFIGGNNLRNEGTKEIARLLQKNNGLNKLLLCISTILLQQIGCNKIEDEGAKEIGIALNKNYTLTT
eukprot:TRINITY_DN659_c0_g1_i11.p6 TRINITY_DN659_c0_g1~~TRINITY_DN659_c0_g1_i11.p6  ORF type:complete len:117 (-),score=9.91 TRINITY_DN659_c0_g1_i11:681-1031(-)